LILDIDAGIPLPFEFERLSVALETGKTKKE
jgi:hypothetical protein